MNELGSVPSQKAVWILQWVACSLRKMKAHEIQDGIIFHTHRLVLNEQTKLRAGFLDMCKPLIEEGHRNTVEFVHYSAKE